MAIFYVIKHISRKHFVSLQRYKITLIPQLFQ